MSKHDFSISRGETLILTLEVTQGDFAGITSVVAALKAAGPNASLPPPSYPVLAEFAVTSKPPTADTLGGWDLTIPALITRQLSPGLYVADANLMYSNGVVEKTNPVVIQIRQGVTT